MKQARPWKIESTEPVRVDQELEEVRLRFHERLRGEQLLLVSLTKALASTSAESLLIIGNIREFAHRLRGGALVFEFEKIGAAAKAVELAAMAAMQEGEPLTNDSCLVPTMQTLAMTIAQATTCPP